MNISQKNPAKAIAPPLPSYELTPVERSAIMALHQNALTASQQLQGALNFLAASHGIQKATLSPDMTRLVQE